MGATLRRQVFAAGGEETGPGDGEGDAEGEQAAAGLQQAIAGLHLHQGEVTEDIGEGDERSNPLHRQRSGSITPTIAETSAALAPQRLASSCQGRTAWRTSSRIARARAAGRR